MMRAVGERRERGTRSKSNVTEDNLLLAFETRLQQIDQGQIETVLSRGLSRLAPSGSWPWSSEIR